jgi:hypothetical protein
VGRGGEGRRGGGLRPAVATADGAFFFGRRDHAGANRATGERSHAEPRFLGSSSPS